MTTSGAGGQSSGSGGDNSSSGGNTGSGGDNSSSSGGNTGSGGSTASGGNTGSGGSVSSSGGNPGAGGNVASSGGATGAGGAKGGNTGAGGSTASGGATGSGGTPASGGATGSGGAAGAKASGGATGSGGATTGSGGSSAGGAGGIPPNTIVPGLMNLYWEGTCVGTRDAGGHNCPLDDNGSNCPSNTDPTKQGTVRSKTIPVMGTANQAYTINIEVIGVIGTRCYMGGVGRQSTASIMTEGYNNSWYVGGTPSNATDWWNSYELHVSPSTGDPSGDVYYFNAFDNPGGSYCDSEATYMVRYPAHFKVLGGGSLKLVLHDYNCQAQQNCGSNTVSTSTCMPRTVDFSTFSKTVMNSFMGGTQAAPTGSLNQPPIDQLSMTYNPQWLMIDVTSVTSP
jgi:hypothetical protein